MGTALCVIIPEGVNSIYEGALHSHGIFIFNGIFYKCFVFTVHKESDLSTSKANITKETSSDPHTVVGITLLIGFVMMLLIDQFSSSLTSNAHYNLLPNGYYTSFAFDSM